MIPDLVEILRREGQRLAVARAEMRDSGGDEAVRLYNARIRRLRKFQRQIDGIAEREQL